jgi:hypothetical protein
MWINLAKKNLREQKKRRCVGAKSILFDIMK